MAGKAYIPPDNGPDWWRDIPGYKGKYRVNRTGEVQRVFQSGLVRCHNKVKKPFALDGFTYQFEK